MPYICKNHTEMTTKLTLTIDKAVLQNAKSYAKGHQQSLSKIVEVYFKTLQNERAEEDLSPQLNAIIQQLPKVSKDFSEENLENSRYEHLSQKHSR